MNKISRLRKLNKFSRLKKIAEWQRINPSDPDTIQNLTDAMTYGNAVQIDYEGSGWRTIQPYGWNTSKDGNILLMCYKDTGEVRSYRMDRITDIYIDDSMIAITNNPDMQYEEDLNQLLELQNQEPVNYEFYDDYPDDMPLLNEDQYYNDSQGVYEDELDLLSNNVEQENQEDINLETTENIIEEEY